MKITKKTVTTVTESTIYQIHKNVKIIDTVVNGGPKTRQMVKSVKEVKVRIGDNPLDFFPIYDPDLKYLETTNPFWFHDKVKDQKWFEGNPIPDDPKDIDPSKIVFTCGYNHSFWTVDLEQIPVVVFGDYIDAGLRSGRYDLENLHKYLSGHMQVKYISDIKLIPYYNNESGSETFFEIKVLPTVKQLLKLLEYNKNRRWSVKIWDENLNLLGINKFRLKESQ